MSQQMWWVLFGLSLLLLLCVILFITDLRNHKRIKKIESVVWDVFDPGADGRNIRSHRKRRGRNYRNGNRDSIPAFTRQWMDEHAKREIISPKYHPTDSLPRIEPYTSSVFETETETRESRWE